MRLARFSVDGLPNYGVVEGDQITKLERNFLEDVTKTELVFPLSAVQLLPPVEPSKIICIGLNFAEHAKEMGESTQSEPLLFFKPPSTLIGSGEEIVLPRQSKQVELEVELAMVVGKKAKNVSRLNAPDYVLGFTVANDVTARDVQFSDLQWARSKAFDTFGPLGPWIETEFDPSDKELISRVNGQLRQRGNTSLMVNHPYDLLAYASENLTLFPGDVVLTGSPAGISSFSSGDLVECEIEGIGVLSNPVA
jgi:2-keto-4-pentenoate hydratase/2-oxohepta-3-ene-1,7-dioic acid hydratase in catechol pathway